RTGVVTGWDRGLRGVACECLTELEKECNADTVGHLLNLCQNEKSHVGQTYVLMLANVVKGIVVTKVNVSSTSVLMESTIFHASEDLFCSHLKSYAENETVPPGGLLDLYGKYMSILVEKHGPDTGLRSWSQGSKVLVLCRTILLQNIADIVPDESGLDMSESGGMGRGRGDASGNAPPKAWQQDGDWMCPNTSCTNVNFAFRGVCNRCGTARPAGASGGGGGGLGRGRGGPDAGGGRGAAGGPTGLFGHNDWSCPM
ncbi:transcription initiation factor TFIID subunit 15 isoform X1, partial [Tanacetum coccineum]